MFYAILFKKWHKKYFPEIFLDTSLRDTARDFDFSK